MRTRTLALACALAFTLAGCERHREDRLPRGANPFGGSQPETGSSDVSPGAGSGYGSEGRSHEGPSGGAIGPGPIVTPE